MHAGCDSDAAYAKPSTIRKMFPIAPRKLWQTLTTRRLLVVFLFLGILIRAVQDANDPDMWWHLATGRLILDDSSIPKADPFSYTVSGTRWYTHEWLAEVGMYGIYLVGGKEALIAASALVVTFTFVLVYLQCSARPHVAVFLVLAGAFASSVTWGVRPQILTMAGLALSGLLLIWYRRGSRWPLVAFPVLTAVWVNLHAGYLLGLAFLAANLVGDGLALLLRRPGQQTLPWGRWRSLVVSALASLAAANLNPNGLAMLRYPFDTLTSSAMSAYIQEWASPDFHHPAFWPFALLLMGGMVIVAMAKRRPLEPSDLVMYVAFSLAALHSSRHIALFAVLAPPIVSRSVSWNPASLRSTTTRLSLWLNWLLLLAGLGAVGLRFRYVVVQDPVHEAQFYPQAALEAIRSQGIIEQHVFNSYNWGGYLIWHEIPVFIDGRADVYGDEFIEDYLVTYRSQPGWRGLLETYDVGYILIEAGQPLSALLAEAPEWDHVYHDDVADVFLQLASQ